MRRSPEPFECVSSILGFSFIHFPWGMDSHLHVLDCVRCCSRVPLIELPQTLYTHVDNSSPKVIKYCQSSFFSDQLDTSDKPAGHVICQYMCRVKFAVEVRTLTPLQFAFYASRQNMLYGAVAGPESCPCRTCIVVRFLKDCNFLFFLFNRGATMSMSFIQSLGVAITAYHFGMPRLISFASSDVMKSKGQSPYPPSTVSQQRLH